MTKTAFLTGKPQTALTLPAFQRKWESSWSNQEEHILFVATIHNPKITGPPDSQKMNNSEWETEKMNQFHELENIKSADRVLHALRASYHTKINLHGLSITTCHLQKTLLFKYLFLASFYHCVYNPENINTLNTSLTLKKCVWHSQLQSPHLYNVGINQTSQIAL